MGSMATGGKEKLYRRPDGPGGTWYIYYFKDGKRVRRSLETTSLKEAKDRRDKILRGEVVLKWGHADKDVAPDEFWKAYEAWAKLHKAKSSIVREKYDWDAFIDWRKPKTLGDVTKGDIGRFKACASETLQWSNRTINDCLVRLGALYNHAANPEVCGYGRDNPFHGFKRLETKTERVRFLTAEQRDKVIETAQGHSRDTYLFCALCAFAGLRTDEAVRSEWGWVDFDEGVVNVDPGKNRRFRTVPLHNRLREVLEPYRKPAGYIVLPDKIEPGVWRTRYEPKRAFKWVMKQSGVEWCTPHTLRHTFASLAVQAGVSLYKVGQWLGHSDPRTTQIYAHLAPVDDDINRF